MDNFFVVGYGSFMDEVSLAKTIKLKPFKLVWIEGYRRIFNLKPSRVKRYHIGAEGMNVAVLNAEEFPGARFNAVIFEVDKDELEKLAIRQQSYRMKEITVLDYDTKEEIRSAYIFLGNKLFRGERVISDEYLPIMSYLEMIRKAAYRIGEGFGKDFDKSTFLASGEPLSHIFRNSPDPL